MKEISPPPGRPTAQEEIFLYQKLLDCLAQEWDALITSQEEAILLLAAEKEQLLEKNCYVSIPRHFKTSYCH